MLIFRVGTVCSIPIMATLGTYVKCGCPHGCLLHDISFGGGNGGYTRPSKSCLVFLVPDIGWPKGYLCGRLYGESSQNTSEYRISTSSSRAIGPIGPETEEERTWSRLSSIHVRQNVNLRECTQLGIFPAHSPGADEIAQLSNEKKGPLVGIQGI